MFFLATLGLGILFCYLQYQGWNSMTKNNLFLSETGNRISASFVYVISGVHAFHVFGGIIILSILFAKLKLSKFKNSPKAPFRIISIYWHFIGILWIYLYVFMLFTRN